MFIEKQLGQDRKWINIDSDMIAENSYLYKNTRLTKKPLSTRWIRTNVPIWIIIEKTVRSHLSANVLDLEKDKEYYETIPMTFIVQDTRLVTISNQDNAYIIEQMVPLFGKPWGVVDL